METIKAFAGVLMPSVHLNIKKKCNAKGTSTKILLSGPAGMLLELDKIRSDWKVGEIQTQASGQFGTVTVFIREVQNA